MFKRGLIAVAALLAACATSSAPHIDVSAVAAYQHPSLSPEALIGHVQVLASDEFEGRAPGTHGEELTLAYIERAYTALGLQPGVTNADGSRSFLQEVPLTSALVTNSPSFTVAGADGARSYTWGNQFVGWTKRVQEDVSIENAPLVFVGYGVVAPERNWNDYAGVDMHGKIAVILINDPDFETADDRGFGGRAMTYYGRWMYKFEEAARQGAAGAIIIHETAPAAYPWSVVQSSNTTRQFDVVHADNGMSRVGVEGWVTTEVGREMLRRAGLDFDALKARAQTRGFRPVPMGALRGSIALHSTIEHTHSYNVIGVLPGTTAPSEAVIYGAHWDHLGRCPAVNGDDICNGALDNATGVAGLIELARHYVENRAAHRSVVFLAVTGEEKGLLGSRYYADNPTFPAANIVADINMDGLSIYGPARDFTIIGSGKSEMDDLTAAAVAAQGRRVRPDPFPERGSFFRSDQFSFAKAGVPAAWVDLGDDLVDTPPGTGLARREEYRAKRYHRPADQFDPKWELTGTAQLARIVELAVEEIGARGGKVPWKPGSPFAR